MLLIPMSISYGQDCIDGSIIYNETTGEFNFCENGVWVSKPGTPPEIISMPSTPSGPASGITGTSYAYTSSGSTSNLEHSIQYRFDWGDESYSDWSSSTGASHTWVDIGSFSVKAQARCATHTDIESILSGSYTVSISCTVPTQVTLVSPANGATGVSTSPTLDWSNVSGTSSYALVVDNNSDFSSPKVNQSGITSSNKSISGLSWNTTYYWRVRATNPCGTGSWSSTWSFTTREEPQTISLYSAIWENRVDADRDAYMESADLFYRISVSHGSVIVYAELYIWPPLQPGYRYAISSPFTISGIGQKYGPFYVDNLSYGLYNFKINIRRYSDGWLLDDMGTENPSLYRVPFE